MKQHANSRGHRVGGLAPRKDSRKSLPFATASFVEGSGVSGFRYFFSLFFFFGGG